MTSPPAPIAVFSYNRPPMLLRTLTTLERCHGFSGDRVHIFCDDARSDIDRDAVDETRRVAAAWSRRHGASVILRDGNRGFRNLSDGLLELCTAFGSAISLDDDHEASPHLLTFLDRALDFYRDRSEVFLVSGYFPGAPLPDDCPDAFFFPSPQSMAWATWHRAWSKFRWDISEDARRILDDPILRHRFDLSGRYPASRLLELAAAGLFESYFIRWYLAMFLHGGVGLCTRRSLVRNFGFTSGVHPGPASEEREAFFNARWAEDVDPSGWQLPAQVTVDDAILTATCNAVRAAGITRHLTARHDRPAAEAVAGTVAAAPSDCAG